MLLRALCILLFALCTTEAKFGYIIGGRDANTGEFPWQGSIQAKTGPNSNQHICGCSLINKRWAVTAAHCILDGYTLGVAFGINEQQNIRTIYRVKRAIVHPRYDKFSAGFDIALLELPAVEFTDVIQPIALPEIDLEIGGDVDALISGWGTTRVVNGQSTPTPNKLQKAHTSVQTHQFCQKYYHNSFVPAHHICIFERRGGASCCFGDSGGPAVIKKNNENVLVGIASWVGSGECDTRLPQVYTKVSFFRNWIRSESGC